MSARRAPRGAFQPDSVMPKPRTDTVKPHPLAPASVKQAAQDKTGPGRPGEAFDEAVVPFSTRLEPTFIKAFKAACISRDVTMQQAVYQALLQWLLHPPMRNVTNAEITAFVEDQRR